MFFSKILQRKNIYVKKWKTPLKTRFLHQCFDITDLRYSRALTRSMRQLLSTYLRRWVSKFCDTGESEKLRFWIQIDLNTSPKHVKALQWLSE